MKKEQVDGLLIREPRGDAYLTLIDALGELAARVSFVVRPDISRSFEGQEVIGKLNPWLDSAIQTLAWPGTTLVGPRAAELRTYSMSREVAEILRDTVNGLFEWVDGYPEDPAFYRADGSVMLFAIAHEREGEVALYVEERDVVLARSPSFDDCVAWRAVPV